MKSEEDQKRINSISEKVIEAAIEVHRVLGPGLLESIYEDCLAIELGKRGSTIKRQLPVPVIYKGELAGQPLRLDLVIEDEVIVEVKAVEKIIPIHQAQLLTYLKLTGFSVGLLLNFNSVLMKDGIRRMVNNFDR
jgi:GxxExxY protein